MSLVRSPPFPKAKTCNSTLSERVNSQLSKTPNILEIGVLLWKISELMYMNQNSILDRAYNYHVSRIMDPCIRCIVCMGPWYTIPCPAKKNCNRNFALTFLILIRWSCALDMFECMVPRYCDVVFAVKEFRNVANGSVEFQGHEKKVVQLASASSALFRDVRDFGTSPQKRLRVLVT